jgi:hypothetical protein
VFNYGGKFRKRDLGTTLDAVLLELVMEHGIARTKDTVDPAVLSGEASRIEY